ncbi:tyrosine-type recombinase/integrase [Sphingomonas aerolata]|uniref:tyrosine-type recombinase/integrase n=1 Tax=Sphingomonas aerolata TaxID=185951 RepID=UPI00141BCED0|nr:site-specific integrase [Sphingomonas aerolata]NII60215.1 integrase [Sphingomonas aerolata]
MMASVNKRKWTYNDVEKVAWQVRYKDERGAYRGKQFDTKKAADTFKRKVEREIEDGVHIPDRQAATVKHFCSEYLAHAAQKMRDGRIGRGRYVIIKYGIEQCIVPVIGDRVMRDLTEAAVEDLYKKLIAGGRMKPMSAKQRLWDLKLIETFAVKRGYTIKTPVALALLELRGVAQKPIRTFMIDEVQHLLKVSLVRPPHGRLRGHAMLNCFLNVAAFCGLRRGEIGALTAAHVDFDRRIIKVRHNRTVFGEIKAPKTTAGVRDVPMPPHVATMLQAWINEHFVPNDGGLLFATRTGQPVNLGNIYRAFGDLLKRAGLDHKDRPFHFHALRHFWASWMIQTGAPLTDASNLLGHSKFDMTLQVYAHSITRPEAKHAIIDGMASQLLPA